MHAKYTIAKTIFYTEDTHYYKYLAKEERPCGNPRVITSPLYTTLPEAQHWIELAKLGQAPGQSKTKVVYTEII